MNFDRKSLSTKINTPAKMRVEPALSRVGAIVLLILMMHAGQRAWSQTTPVLAIAPTGTNQLAITITNGMTGANYELWWTPVLANPDYPWAAAAVGSPGQTNFTINLGVYSSGFYEAVWDTNAIPLWEAADPHNQSTGILAVFIDSPTNGMTLQ